MTLLQFLRYARQVHLAFLADSLPEPPIYVLGNPSADLDSIISAIVYSYCANNYRPNNTPRPHIPLINLPNVPAGPELYRLRPEFATALWLSTNFPTLKPEERFENVSESAGNLFREHIITVADFAQNLKERQGPHKLIADAVMVDWNAMPIRGHEKGTGSVTGLEDVTFRTIGCIDHHVDEHFVPARETLPYPQPMTIEPGPGSCCSLVTKELDRKGVWRGCSATSSMEEMAQIAKLALAAILIDTSNLTAEGKVEDVDVESVAFLVKCVGETDVKWDMVDFYENVLAAKKHSLDLLTFEEVLDRDYKDWTETTHSSGVSLKLGFCSAVKPIRWIIQKAGGCEKFLEGIRSFAAGDDKELEIVVVMTSFTSSEGEFSRELFIGVVGHQDVAVKVMHAFIEKASTHLGLEQWKVVDNEQVKIDEKEIRSTLDGESHDLWSRLWLQTNSAASRKQVAPLLRSAVANL